MAVQVFWGGMLAAALSAHVAIVIAMLGGF